MPTLVVFYMPTRTLIKMIILRHYAYVILFIYVLCRLLTLLQTPDDWTLVISVQELTNRFTFSLFSLFDFYLDVMLCSAL